MVDSESIGSTISRKRGAWRVDCGFVGAVCGRSDYISLFDHLLEHNDRYAGQLDVAVCTFGTPGLHHSDSPGQYDAVESMPETLQRTMQFSPSTHFVSFAQAVLYRGAGLDVVWQDSGVIAALGLLFFGVALMRFRRMLVQIRA